MLNVINIRFGNNNDNKLKKIYNKGDIFLVRPQYKKNPYKIISIKEKKIDLNDYIKVRQIPNQKSIFTLNDICSISNYSNPSQISFTNNLNNSTVKERFTPLNNYCNKLTKNNSDIALRKKILDIEKQKQSNDENIKNKIIKRNYENNFFLKTNGLSKYNTNYNNDLKLSLNSNIKEENSKFFNYDSTLINRERNKNCYKLKYNKLTSKIILSDTNEKNLIFKRNFDEQKNIRQMKDKYEKKNKIKPMKFAKSNRDIKIKRLKTSKIDKIKVEEKIIYKIKRPFSTDNRKKKQKINFELKTTNRKNKIEENKNIIEKEDKTKKFQKKLKLQKKIKNLEYLNYVNEINNNFNFNNFIKLDKFIEFKPRKNSDIFEYINYPRKSKDTINSKEKEYKKDFSEFKSVINK